MRVPAWEGNWHQRIEQRVRERGFDSVTAFVDPQPVASLYTLACQLGRDRDVAAAQLRRMLIMEAQAAGTIERCARDLLVRQLHEELPQGWPREWDNHSMESRYRVTLAIVEVSRTLPRRHRDDFDRVADALLQASVPAGWLPASPDDPILEEVFRTHWNVPAEVRAREQAHALQKWQREWLDPIQARVRERGFDSVRAFAESRSGVMADELARELGFEHLRGGIELDKVLVYEARKSGTMERCARDILARRIRENLPEGWQRGWTYHPFGSGPRLESAFMEWSESLGLAYENPVRQVFAALDQMPIPEGWLPEGPDDPILVEAFANHWRDPAPE